MYKGLGNQLVEAEDYLLNIGLTEFGFNPSQEGEKTSQEFVNGVLINSEEFPGATTFRFTLTYNRLTWQRQGFHLNQRSRRREVPMPIGVLNSSVPGGAGPYVVQDDYITVENDELRPIQVAITSSGTWGKSNTLKRIDTGTPQPGEVLVNTTAGSLTFNAAQAGAPFVTPRYGLFTAETYGGSNGVQEVGFFEYWGEIIIPEIGPTGEWFHVRKARILNIPPFSVTNAAPSIAVECSMFLEPGDDFPWEIIDSNSAVPVVA